MPFCRATWILLRRQLLFPIGFVFLIWSYAPITLTCSWPADNPATGLQTGFEPASPKATRPNRRSTPVRPLAILLLAIPSLRAGPPGSRRAQLRRFESLPRLLACRIDNCESKDGDHRDIQIRDDDKGDPVTNPVDGNSRAVMYECSEETTAADIIHKAAIALCGPSVSTSPINSSTRKAR